MTVQIKKHGSPYDRGAADAYYERPFDPHYWPQGTYKGVRINADEMTEDDLNEYRQGYNDQMESGDFKDWG